MSTNCSHHMFQSTITPRHWGVAVMAVGRAAYDSPQSGPTDPLGRAADAVHRVEAGFVRSLLSLVLGRERVRRTGRAIDNAGMGLVERTGIGEVERAIEKGKVDVPVGEVTLTLDARGVHARWQGRERHIAWQHAGHVATVQLDSGPALLLAPAPLRSPKDLNHALLVPLEGADPHADPHTDPHTLLADVARWRQAVGH